VDLWWIGLIAVLVVGVAVIAYGAVHDRNRNRGAAAAILSPPKRTIPGFVASRTPHYLSELQARRRPVEAAESALTTADRETIRKALSAASTVTVNAGYLSKDFVTDSQTGWATLAAPQVLLCAEPIRTVRELLVALEHQKRAGAPLVLAAAEYAPEVRATLEVNVIQRLLPLVAVLADQQAAGRIGAATGAQPVPRSDLQAGYLPTAMLGSCARWVAGADLSHVIVAESGGGPQDRRPSAADPEPPKPGGPEPQGVERNGSGRHEASS
jgi:hypothetical protein